MSYCSMCAVTDNNGRQKLPLSLPTPDISKYECDKVTTYHETLVSKPTFWRNLTINFTCLHLKVEILSLSNLFALRSRKNKTPLFVSTSMSTSHPFSPICCKDVKHFYNLSNISFITGLRPVASVVLAL